MNIIEFLNKNENTRKIFGKREIKIIEKQVLGVNLSQSEKNRLSRDIRKKLDFIREITKYDFDLDVKKGNVINKIILYKKNEILESKYYSKIKRIILYGSTTENKRRLGSDIDIAVEFDNISSKEIKEFIIHFSVDKMIQLEVYNTLPEDIKKEIDLKGKVIYEKKNK